MEIKLCGKKYRWQVEKMHNGAFMAGCMVLVLMLAGAMYGCMVIASAIWG